MIKHSLKAYTALLLLLLAVLGACKKDNHQAPSPVMKVGTYYPNSGSAGTLVTIEGENFDTDISSYTAKVGNKQAQMVSATSTYLVLMVPEGAGTGKVELNYKGKSYEIGNYTYQQLSVKQILPNRGPIGTNIRISGVGFSDPGKQATVTVNNNAANIISLTDTLIIATVPENTISGPVQVKLNDKSSMGPVFRVQAIFDIIPKTGGKGTKIKLKGSGFELTPSKNLVSINGKPAQVIAAKEDELTIVAPEGVKTGAVDLRIDESVIPGPAFTVVPAPTISEVTPLSGPAGITVTITGTGFSTISGETKVTVNNKEAAIKSIAVNSIALTIPEDAGSGPVKVSVNDQVANGPVFTEQAVGIARISPESGAAGTIVTIYGVGFSTTPENNVVTFNGAVAHVNTATATQLTVTVPASASSGTVKVRVNGKEASSPRPFTMPGVSTLTKSLPVGVTAIAAGLNGEVYATDRTRNNVLKIALDGTITVFAGSANGEGGNTDGIGTSARLNQPVGIVVDKQGNVFVIEFSGNVKKITPEGRVSMFVASVTSSPSGLAIDNRGTMYTGADPGSFSAFYMISPAGQAMVNWDLYADPEGRIGIDGDGKIYASDVNSVGRYGIGDGTYERVIGNGFAPGYADGSYNQALFGKVGNMLWNNKNLLLVCDPDNNALRSINPVTHRVGTIFKAARGLQDGGLSTAKFGDVSDIAIGANGELYILDKANKAIRKVIM